jgi:uncharacterized damage-inducible protein DinB
MTAAAAALAAGVAAEFRRRLRGEYLPRIGRCVELLGDKGVWQRPAPNVNAVGNLLLHLCGNVTQWILVGLGGEADRRDRPAEFAAEGGVPAQDLMRRLADVVDAACACVDRQTVDDLLRVRTIQQRYRESGLQAVLHVLEHFSGHAGQIYFWTKQVTGQDLKFYDL